MRWPDPLWSNIARCSALVMGPYVLGIHAFAADKPVNGKSTGAVQVEAIPLQYLSLLYVPLKRRRRCELYKRGSGSLVSV